MSDLGLSTGAHSADADTSAARFAGASAGWARFSVGREVRALDLIRHLLGSKPAATRVFAEHRAYAVSTGAERMLQQQTLLHRDDMVEIRWPQRDVAAQRPATAAATQRAAAPRALEVYWEDPFALAVEKCAGELVHSDGSDKPALISRVFDYVSAAGGMYAQPVQRLDEDTTGIVLVSKAPDFQPLFDELVAGHDLCKIYLAVVEGSISASAFTIDAPIARDRHDARKMRVGKTGKPSQTKVAVLAQSRGRSLVACRLMTGRRHQIRVHLAHIHHPIVGDALYGAPGCPLMLHAYREHFCHPVTGEPVEIQTTWPSRFSTFFSPVLFGEDVFS
ncbi:MAG: RluA family pseudouridine synthase [Atopobiaceae bacterium]